jgi:Rifampin ADP-ribosyl transferase
MSPLEDDPNVTNKRFPGNPTQSYRTRHPLRAVPELESWQGHAPEVLKACWTTWPSSGSTVWTSSRTSTVVPHTARVRIAVGDPAAGRAPQTAQAQ